METICNVCKEQTEIDKPVVRKEDDLEIQYITCPHCHQEYIIAVTDPALRKDIKKYKRLRQVIRSGKARVATYREAERQKEANVLRSRELICGYLGL